jgi:alkaline phosphatase D
MQIIFMKIFLSVILFLFFINALLAQQNKLISGPWAGDVQMRTAIIWAEVSADVKKVAVKYYDIKKPLQKSTVVYKGVLGSDFNPIKIPLNGLELNTVYKYSLLIDDKETTTTFDTKFTTQDLWQWRKPAPDFSFLAGSCNYVNDPAVDRPGKPYGGDSSIFETMAKTPAAFHVWMGDNWYTREVDFGSAWGLNYRASHDRSQKILQPFMASMPQYAIWDDHDYGPNDEGKSFILKEESRKIFKNYMLNPSYGEEEKGIYTKITYSDADIFLTDDRYFRSEDNMPDSVEGKVNMEKYFFGPTQMEWLKNSLQFSDASFKIIVVGSQVLNPKSIFSESMQRYSYEYNELLDFIKKQKINGVVFFTGDRHHSEVIKFVQDGFYPMYDVTVSPYTSGISKVSGIEKDNPYRVKNTLVEAQNFAKISIVGGKENRIMKIDFIGTKGEQLATWSVKSNELIAP